MVGSMRNDTVGTLPLDTSRGTPLHRGKSGGSRFPSILDAITHRTIPVAIGEGELPDGIKNRRVVMEHHPRLIGCSILVADVADFVLGVVRHWSVGTESFVVLSHSTFSFSHRVPSWTKSVRPSSLLLFYVNRGRGEEKARHIHVSIFSHKKHQHVRYLAVRAKKGITKISARYAAVCAMGLDKLIWCLV